MWCYATSSIQLLFSIPELRDAILKYVCDISFQLPNTIDDIDKLPEDKINNSGILCALKTAFEELNKSTTQFTKENWENDFIKGNIDNKSVAYLMKGFLHKRMPAKERNINSNQQDVSEFITYLIEIVDNDTKLKLALDALRWKHKTTYMCENPEYKKPDIINEENELFVQLILQEFIDEKNISYTNKITEAKRSKTISLQDLINYNSKPTRLDGDNKIDGCGPNSGKGPGTKADNIQPTVANKYIIFQINKGSSPHDASTISNQYSINAETIITIDKNEKIKYNIYGAILYGGDGSSGHYMFERVYNPPDKTGLASDIDKLPYIMYNSGKVTPNDNQSYTIAKNAYYIIYKRVISGTDDKDTGTSTDDKDTGTDDKYKDTGDTNAGTDNIDTDTNTNKSPYEILGVEKEGLTRSILKTAYRKKILETHPNKGGKKEDFIKIKDAYDKLKPLFKNNAPITTNTATNITTKKANQSQQESNLIQLTDETFILKVNNILSALKIQNRLTDNITSVSSILKMLNSPATKLKFRANGISVNKNTRERFNTYRILTKLLKDYKNAQEQGSVDNFLKLTNKNNGLKQALETQAVNNTTTQTNQTNQTNQKNQTTATNQKDNKISGKTLKDANFKINRNASTPGIAAGPSLSRRQIEERNRQGISGGKHKHKHKRKHKTIKKVSK